ncbi:MAG: arylsulfatase [Sedimentisphaerales bacterium]|nr:arylsulfatase [Sedimentisphaerales bacterium]
MSNSNTISRREFLKFTGSAMACLSVSGCMQKIINPNTKRPNILLIVADDLGYSDLGCYGGEIQTPNLDTIANNGIKLTRFYSTGRCCPSRASILTGLYSHRAGLGYMVSNLGQPGYRGRIADDAVTIGQALQLANYRTFISGKWHLGTNDPTQYGFEEFFGTLVSAQTFWDPNHYVRLPRGHNVRQYEEGEFYGTNALTDNAIDFINEGRKTPDKPWFLYLAYNSPHFPLHAPKEDIAKYADKYEVGWDEIREKRHEKMKELGIISKDTKLTPRSPYTNWGERETKQNPAWQDLPEDRKKDLARRMAIFAAMVDIMDRNIGRLVTDLKNNNELENTLIIFISDNGACAEWDPIGFDGRTGPNNVLHTGEQIDTMGSAGTYHSVGSGWANASNTPWRLYKHYNHEGGISGPCIVHWPAGLKRHGDIDNRPSHLIDLMPTILEAAKATYPKELNGLKTAPLAGTSMLPLLRGKKVEERVLCFEHEGNRAIIDGRWKLSALRDKQWELYNIENDRTELNDLALEHPEIVEKLDLQWNEWAKENQVTPLIKNFRVGYLSPSR